MTLNYMPIELTECNPVVHSGGQPDNSHPGPDNAVSPEVAALLRLPFVRDTTAAERRTGMEPRLFWDVQPKGDFREDWKTGEAYAHLALDYVAKGGGTFVLSWVVMDMLRIDRDVSSVEGGFLSVIGSHAAAGRSFLGKRAA